MWLQRTYVQKTALLINRNLAGKKLGLSLCDLYLVGGSRGLIPKVAIAKAIACMAAHMRRVQRWPIEVRSLLTKRGQMKPNTREGWYTILKSL